MVIPQLKALTRRKGARDGPPALRNLERGFSLGLRLLLRFALRLGFAVEIERHGSADEILQGRLIDLLAFVDVNGAPHISLEAGVE
jgi:hypothetical protein